MRYLFSFLTILVSASLGIAQPAIKAIEPTEKTAEKWEAVYARDAQGADQQIGFSKLAIEPVNVGQLKLTRTIREVDLRIRRGPDLVAIHASAGTDENDDGKVVGVFMKMGSGKQLMWNITGEVKGKQLVINQAGLKNGERTIGWDDSIISLQKEQNLLRDKKVKAGDKFEYRHYESSLQFPVTIRVQVEGEEEVAVPRQKGKRKLLRVELEAEEIQGAQLPPETTWVDPKTYEPVMSRAEMPGFGVLTLVRTSKEIATAPVDPRKLPNIMDLLSIRLPQSIKFEGGRGDIHDLSGLVFKVTTRTNVDPKKIIKEDGSQKIAKVDRKERTFELHIEAKRTPAPMKKILPAAAEYTQSNHFITSADKLVQDLAKKAIGTEKDPLKQARLIEQFVHGYITEVTFTQALDTAAQVAESRKGDCTEFGMLMAAMCRAANLPSRTAIGLVMVNRPEAPFLGFHMWTEVYIDGDWLGFDATLGRGGIGPGHIKITDHSWDKVESLLPLLPVQGFIQSQPAFEILSATK